MTLKTDPKDYTFNHQPNLTFMNIQNNRDRETIIADNQKSKKDSFSSIFMI